MVNPLNLNLRHLDAVAVIEKTGHLSDAAHAVNVSQPALSQALANLERTLGCRLFVRHTTKMTPTDAALSLIPRIKRAIDYLVEGTNRFRLMHNLSPILHIQRHMTMTQLRALLAVADSGSYTLATQETGLAQSSLHRAIRDCEILLASPLLMRRGRIIQPTEHAVSFIRTARLAINELRQGLTEMKQDSKENPNVIVIGSRAIASNRFLPDLLVHFSSQNPQSRIQISEGSDTALLKDLLNGTIDLIIGSLPGSDSLINTVQTPLFLTHLSIIGCTDHPLAHKKNVTLEELHDWPWIVPPTGSPTHQKWSAIFEDAGLEAPIPRIECDSPTLIRSLLLEGKWLSFLSSDQLSLDLEQKTLIRIGDTITASERPVSITTRSDWMPTGIQSHFIAEVQKYMQNLPFATMTA